MTHARTRALWAGGAIAALVSLLGPTAEAAAEEPSPSPEPTASAPAPEPTVDATPELESGADGADDASTFGDFLVTDGDEEAAAPEISVDSDDLTPASEVVGDEDSDIYAAEPFAEPATSIETVDVVSRDDLDSSLSGAEPRPGTNLVVGAAAPPFAGLLEDIRDQSVEELAMAGELGDAYSTLPRAEVGDTLRVSVISQLGGQGVPGAAFTAEFTTTDSLAPAWVDVAFDISAFENAFGGDYGDRLFLVAVPECAATTPDDPSCWIGVPLETAHVGDGALRAYVPSGSQGLLEVSSGMSAARAIDLTSGQLFEGMAAEGLVAAAPSGKTIVAAVSGASSQAGTFKATDLAPRGTWGVTEPEGGFTYAIPITLPPTSAGGAPSVGLSYSSQAVDGKTAASNSQAGIIGEGWSSPVSFIERLHKPCAEDSLATSQELCWDSPYSGQASEAAYVLSLQGNVQELVWLSTSGNVAEYVAKSDPTLRVKRYFNQGTTASGGDNDDEYFEVLTSDGSRFLFGYAPAGEATNSVAWQPVVGNQPGEPGYGLTDNRVPNQAYRFFLDLSVDTSGNAATYYYVQATNNYAVSTTLHTYVRDTQLQRIEYGSVYAATTDTFTEAAEAKVEFLLAERCVDGAQFYDSLSTGNSVDSKCDPAGPSTKAQYPDVPVDLLCTQVPCGVGQNSPTYFTTLRLDRISTFARGVGDAWVKVEDTQLITAFPTTTDGSARSLWLDAVYTQGYGDPTHGEDASTTPVRTYLTKFSGIHLKNRVDWDMSATAASASGMTRPMDHLRIQSVYTDMGGRIDVTYAQAGAANTATLDANTTLPLCPAGGKTDASYATWAAVNTEAKINSASNDQLCFLVKQGETTAIYHNYVVTRIDLFDAVGGQDTETHHYTYGGSPAYALADSVLDPASPANPTSTYSKYRGYRTVTSWVGDGTQAPKTTNQYYLATGGPVTSLFDGASRPDANVRRAGMLESSRTVNSAGLEVSASKMVYQAGAVGNPPSFENTTATFLAEHGPYIVLTTQVLSRSTDSGTTVTRTTSTTYDQNTHAGEPRPRFVPTEVVTTSELTQGTSTTVLQSESQCQQIDYAAASSPYIVVPVAARSYDGGCGSAGTLTGHVNVAYDGATTPGDTAQTPNRGLVTQEQVFSTAIDSTVTTAEYDDRGRITKAWLPLSPTTGSPTVAWEYGEAETLWTTTTTRALGATSTTYTERGHGNTVKFEGATAKDWTHYAYDGLGLLIAGWAPQQWGQSATPDLTTDIPTVLYRYDLYTDGPSLRSTPVSVTTAPYVSAKWNEVTHATEFTASAITDTTRRSVTFLDGFGRPIEQHAVSPGDTLGRVVTATQYNSLGQVAWTSAPFFEAARVQVYDAAGVSAAKQRELEDIPTATTYTYDSLGRTHQVTAVAAGVPIKDDADVISRTTTTYSGLSTTVVSADGVSTSSTADVLGRMVEQSVDPDGPNSGIAPHVTAYDYATLTAALLAAENLGLPAELVELTDAQRVGSQRVTVTDPDDNATLFESNLAGQRTLMVDPNAGATAYEYDDNGQTLEVRSPAGTIFMTYDALGRLTERETEDPLGNESSSAAWEYVLPGDQGALTDIGLLRSSTSNTVWSEGILTTTQELTYDDLHRPLTSTTTLPESSVLGDLSGQEFTTKFSDAAQTPGSGYDALGQPTTLTVPAMGGLPEETLVTTYRRAGSAQALTLQSGTGEAALVTGVTFSRTGQLQSRAYGNGLVRSYDWDAETRALIGIDAQFPDLTGTPDTEGRFPAVHVQKESFVRDVMGRITQSTNEVPVSVDPDGEGSAPAVEQVTAECFRYDGFNRLESAWTVAGSGAVSCGEGAPASVTDAGWDASSTAYAQAWDYYDGGRIDTLTERVNGALVTQTFHYDDAAHPAAVTSTTGGADAGTFEYDAAGRMTQRNVAGLVDTELTWDVTNSLVESDGQGGHTVYAYDASGQRVAQATLPRPGAGEGGSDLPGTATAYVASGQVEDPDTGVADDGALTATRYYTFGGATVAIRTGPEDDDLALMLGDEQGSTSVMMPVHLDGSGAMLAATLADAAASTRTAYTPYGELRGGDEADNTATDRGWLGQVEDRVDGASGTGLTYLNARYYDPATMRFISPDPLLRVSDPRTLDPYQYSFNNPIVYTDANGMNPFSDVVSGFYEQGATVGSDWWDHHLYKAPFDWRGFSTAWQSDWTEFFQYRDEVGWGTALDYTFNPINHLVGAGQRTADGIAEGDWKAAGGSYFDTVLAGFETGATVYGGVKLFTPKGAPAAAPKFNGAAPVRKGQAGVNQVADDLVTGGNEIVAREVCISVCVAEATASSPAKWVSVRVDLLVRMKDGVLKFFEVKNGPSAGGTPNQNVGYPALNNGAVFVVNTSRAGRAGWFKGQTVTSGIKVQIEKIGRSAT